MSKNLTRVIAEQNQEYNALYKDRKVKIITSFKSKEKTIALIEDENGEIYEVSKEYIYEI